MIQSYMQGFRKVKDTEWINLQLTNKMGNKIKKIFQYKLISSSVLCGLRILRGSSWQKHRHLSIRSFEI